MIFIFLFHAKTTGDETTLFTYPKWLGKRKRSVWPFSVRVRKIERHRKNCRSCECGGGVTPNPLAGRRKCDRANVKTPRKFENLYVFLTVLLAELRYRNSSVFELNAIRFIRRNTLKVRGSVWQRRRFRIVINNLATFHIERFLYVNSPSMRP